MLLVLLFFLMYYLSLVFLFRVLDSTAVIMGNIKSKSLQINNGAAIEGLCSQCYADANRASVFDD